MPIVYDVTEFIFDHPGGEEFILQHAGKDISDIMKDEIEHLHSESAYELLEQYFIGDLMASQTASQETAKETSVAKKTMADYTETEHLVRSGQKASVPGFIDLNKPMFLQVWNAKYNKEYYLKQVHIPRYVKGSAPLFGHPALEIFTKTPWYVIPMVWLPFCAFCMMHALETLEIWQAASLFVLGLFNWTILEYVFHRFLFHMEAILPDHPAAFTFHFLTHGIHHLLPMDGLRLVMPPVLFGSLAYPVWNFYKLFLPVDVVLAFGCGTFVGYVCYDLMHYYFHHGKPLGAHIKEMKTYHLDHHYKEANLGFGVTSKFWDRMFGTLLN